MWFSRLYDAVTAQIEHELDGLGYDGNADGCEALENIRCVVDDVNRERHSAALAAPPIRLGHLPHEDVPESVVAQTTGCECAS